MLQFYNTKTRQIEEFKAIDDNNVRLYTCGPTVYNNLHVGNWVAYVRWDILVRTLQASGYDVKRVMNITDVGHLVSDADDGEDKMQKGAQREGTTAWEVANRYTDNFIDGMNKLKLIEPTYITKATDYITQQLELVKVLKQKGFTYQIDDGIYFDTAKFPSYADFAHLNLDELKEGARVESNPQKHNPSDFALWKFSPANQHRDMEWDTPTDLLDNESPKKGFPGWHLECSAMAIDKLGETIDIHTGGIDHIPVHHTNEIAQSEAATGKPFANYWLHNNFLLVDGTKVSKSLGNTFELHDLEDKGFCAADFKMFVLQSHYRTESNFTWENIQAAKNRLHNWQAAADLRWQAYEPNDIHDDTCPTDENLIYMHSAQSILLALQNDLDTPKALVAAEEGLSFAEAHGLSLTELASFNALLDDINNLLGINLIRDDITTTQKELLSNRQKARDDQNWQTSDELRNTLLKQGIEIRDTTKGQIWSRI